MNFQKEIKAGFFARWIIRTTIKEGCNEINSYGKRKLEYTEDKKLFSSVFTITGSGFPDEDSEMIQEWVDDIDNFETD